MPAPPRSGQPLHLGPGPAAVGESGTGTAETLAGLTLVDALGRQAALTGAPLLVTSDDAITHALNENVIRGGYAAAGRAGEAPLVGRIAARTVEGHGQGVRMLAHRDPLAYAAAAGDVVEHEGALHSITSGGFGPEYLLLGEAQARAGVPAVAGATNPQALATMLIAARQTLIGEEIYGAGRICTAPPPTWRASRRKTWCAPCSFSSFSSERLPPAHSAPGPSPPSWP